MNECFKCKNFLPENQLQIFSCNHSLCICCIIKFILKELINNLPDDLNNLIKIKCKCNEGEFFINFYKLNEIQIFNNFSFSQKICLNHNKIISDFCKNDKILLCEECKIDHLKLQHELINIENFYENLRKKLLNIKFKTFEEFSNNLNLFEEYFLKEINIKFNNEINKCNELINKINLIKEKITEQKNNQINKEKILFNLIKKYYYKFYSDINNLNSFKLNDYFFLNQLNKIKFDIENFNIKKSEILIPELEKISLNLEEISNTKKFIFQCVYPNFFPIQFFHKSQEIYSNFKYKISCVTSISFNNSIAASSIENIIKIFIQNSSFYEFHKNLEGHKEKINSLCSIENYLISCSNDKTVRIWDIKNYTCFQIIEEYLEEINKVIPFYDNNLKGFFNIGNETCIYFYIQNESSNFKIKNYLDDGHEDKINDIALLDNNDLVSGGEDCILTFWKYNNNGNYVCLNGIGTIYSVSTVCKIKDKVLVGLNNYTLNLYGFNENLNVYEEKLKVSREICHNKLINQMIYLKDNRIASCSFDKTIRIFRFNETVNEIICDQINCEHNSVVFGLAEMKNGKLISVGNDKNIIFYKRYQQ